MSYILEFDVTAGSGLLVTIVEGSSVSGSIGMSVALVVMFIDSFTDGPHSV